MADKELKQVAKALADFYSQSEKLRKFLGRHNASQDFLNWVANKGYSDLGQVWANCENPDWLLRVLSIAGARVKAPEVLRNFIQVCGEEPVSTGKAYLIYDQSERVAWEAAVRASQTAVSLKAPRLEKEGDLFTSASDFPGRLNHEAQEAVFKATRKAQAYILRNLLSVDHLRHLLYQELHEDNSDLVKEIINSRPPVYPVRAKEEVE